MAVPRVRRVFLAHAEMAKGPVSTAALAGRLGLTPGQMEGTLRNLREVNDLLGAPMATYREAGTNRWVREVTTDPLLALGNVTRLFNDWATRGEHLIINTRAGVAHAGLPVELADAYEAMLGAVANAAAVTEATVEALAATP